MAEMHEVRLEGCRPEPLIAYLKAVGVLRLVAEQEDPGARGLWDAGVFVLSTRLSEDDLSRFFLDRYRPTPLLAPWNGGSGFYPKDNTEGIGAIEASTSERLAEYAVALRQGRELLKARGFRAPPKDDEKRAFLGACRRWLSDGTIPWLDATFALTEDQPRFAPLLGSGGNDGRLDFTNNHMQRLASVLSLDGTPPTRSRAWLEAALFGRAGIPLLAASVGQFHPAGAGGANATQGFEAPTSLVNPWDFVLMMEGALLLAGSVTRRLGDGRGRAVFPFAFAPTAAGWGSLADAEEASGRGELWLPLWKRPASLGEVRQVFAEGRAQVGRRQAREGLDVARAAVLLGVDRGVEAFQRYGFLRRNGLAYLAAPLGRVPVVPRPEGELLADADFWFGALRGAARRGNVPNRVPAAVRAVEAAMFDFCLRGGAGRLQDVLVALGEAEHAAAGCGKPEEVAPRPLQQLSPGWLRAADDGAAGFRLAAALASMHHRELGGLRVHMEPVVWERGRYAWAESSGTVAWSAASLERNLAAALGRRLVEGDLRGLEGSVLAAAASASLADVDAFLRGGVDDARLKAVLWGLVGLREPPVQRAPPSESPPTLPRAYALLKLLFLPFPLRWGSEEVALPPSPEVLRVLARGDGPAACAVAARILRGKGLVPQSSTFEVAPPLAQRLAASLLIPIAPPNAGRLARLVLRPPAQEIVTRS